MRQFRKAARLDEVEDVPVVVVDEVVVDEAGDELAELDPQALRTTAQRIPSAAASSVTPIRRRAGCFLCASFISVPAFSVVGF